MANPTYYVSYSQDSQTIFLSNDIANKGEWVIPGTVEASPAVITSNTDFVKANRFFSKI